MNTRKNIMLSFISMEDRKDFERLLDQLYYHFKYKNKPLPTKATILLKALRVLRNQEGLE